MKTIKIIFFILIIISLSFSVSALNLDVDNDLSNFAEQNLLNESIKESLSNPFFIKNKLEDISEQKELTEENFREDFQLEPTPPVENREEINEKKESQPEIVINGLISASNSRMALLISYQQENQILEIGSSVDGYRLTAYENGEATFIKNGRKIKFLY